MDEQLKKLRKQLLTFRWVGIGLGVLAFPAPIIGMVAGGGAYGFIAVPVLVLCGLGCMIAGIATRSKIKNLRATAHAA